MKVITFGEIMLRLKSPEKERILQSPIFEASFCGAEANVAVSLANYGINTSFVTILPENAIGFECKKELQKFNVGTEFVRFVPGRMGIMYLESGANQRPSKVVYDRTASAIATASKSSINWPIVLKNADWLHVSGITPAISESAAQMTNLAVQCAKKQGITVSCDLNYRKLLWKYGKTPYEVMRKIVSYVDVLIANEEDIQKTLNISSDIKIGDNIIIQEYEKLSEQVVKQFPNIKIIAITLRESQSADNNYWSACLYSKGKFFVSQKYNICNIIDRVGSGDSFTGGLIYGLNKYNNPQKALDFATAASCLKHSILGDFNRVTIEEVENLMGGSVNGRVIR